LCGRGEGLRGIRPVRDLHGWKPSPYGGFQPRRSFRGSKSTSEGDFEPRKHLRGSKGSYGDHLEPRKAGGGRTVRGRTRKTAGSRRTCGVRDLAHTQVPDTADLLAVSGGSAMASHGTRQVPGRPGSCVVPNFGHGEVRNRERFLTGRERAYLAPASHFGNGPGTPSSRARRSPCASRDGPVPLP
jgi:hypothetical protein